MGMILRRMRVILIIMHASTIVAMENHNWWQNGKDADPSLPNREQTIDQFVAARVALLPPEWGAKVKAAIAEGRINSKEFCIHNAARILEQIEDEYEDLEEKEERQEDDRRFCFFDPSSAHDEQAD